MFRLITGVTRAAYISVMLLLAAIIIVPHFLDRTYYAGEPGNHYDGARFFNPDEGTPSSARPARAFSTGRFVRFLLGRDRAPWPDEVPVVPTRPPARIDDGQMRVTWIGHATVLVQTHGLNILTDPIWSDYASPLPPVGPRRHRAPGVRFEDLPKIDLVLVSHNHYDHMDLPTLRRLWDRDKPVIVTALGNGAIMRKWGIDATMRDWGESVALRPGVEVFVDRVHHWSSRLGKDRNRALWSGFTVKLAGGNLFFAGDTGLGDGRWPYEAAAHGPVRFALIPIGAYEPRDVMEPNHINPREAVAVFERLGAMYALGIHWGTFQLSAERIDAPVAELRGALAATHIGDQRFRTLEAGEAWNIPPMPSAPR